MQYNYNTAPWDTNIWIGTILIIGSSITFLVFGDMLLKIAISVIGFVIFLPTFFVVGLPLGYTISEQGILIRQIMNIIIRISDIQSVENIDRIIPIRRLGNGGLFGYTGEFILNSEENVTASCTRWTNVVRIKTQSATYIISPSDPNGFCNKVNDLIFVHNPSKQNVKE